MKNITVTITKEHFTKAFSYVAYCPLRVALEEMFSENRITVGGTFANIDEDNYDIPWIDIWGGNDSKYPGFIITSMCNHAKEDTSTYKFEPITFTLKQII